MFNPNQAPKLNNTEREQRITEIKNYVDEYFKKYITNEDSSMGFMQGTSLSRFFWTRLDSEEMKPVKDILEKKLSGKSLVDLGCGSKEANLPYDLKIPLKKFTAVDIDPPIPTLNPDGSSEEVSEIQMMKNNGIKDASIVKEDILTYVMNLSEKSSNFFLSALDDDVIKEKKYWIYLAEEISRATEDNGIVIDGGVGEIGYYLDKEKFKLIYSDENTLGKRIYEKIKN